MNIHYEIFQNKAALLSKNNAINNLLGYPNLETKTENYRRDDRYEHPTSGEWAGAVTDELISAMTPQEKLSYYDDSDLKTWEWLIENGWFSEE